MQFALRSFVFCVERKNRLTKFNLWWKWFEQTPWFLKSSSVVQDFLSDVHFTYSQVYSQVKLLLGSQGG